MVPNGRWEVLLATSRILVLLSRTISAALFELRIRCPLIDKHSYPGRKSVPAKSDAGVIVSMTMVPFVFVNEIPTASVGLCFMTFKDNIDGIMNGSRSFAGMFNRSCVWEIGGPICNCSVVTLPLFSFAFVATATTLSSSQNCMTSRADMIRGGSQTISGGCHPISRFISSPFGLILSPSWHKVKFCPISGIDWCWVSSIPWLFVDASNSIVTICPESRNFIVTNFLHIAPAAQRSLVLRASPIALLLPAREVSNRFSTTVCPTSFTAVPLVGTSSSPTLVSDDSSSSIFVR